MDTVAVLKKEKIFLLINFILGVVFMAVGIFIESATNNKTLVAISFIPFSLAIAALFKMTQLKRNPWSYVEESDERIIAAKNKADAISLRVIRYILFLFFLAFMINYPEEIFESLIWWFLLLVSLVTVLLSSRVFGNVNKNYKPENK